MTRISWIAVGIALAAGFGAGVIAGPKLLPPAGPNLVDFSALPEELREQHRDEVYLRAEIKTYEMGQEVLARRAAEQASRTPIKLPEGIDTLPLGELYQPGANVHWPDGVDGELGEALDAAKGGWVVLNYWASWCAPCVHELPEMGEAVPVYQERGITLIAANTDPMHKDTPESVRNLFVEKGVENLVPYAAEGLTVDVMLAASGQSATNTELPTNIIFAPGGVPYAMFNGGNMTADKVWMAPDTLEFMDGIVDRN